MGLANKTGANTGWLAGFCLALLFCLLVFGKPPNTLLWTGFILEFLILGCSAWWAYPFAKTSQAISFGMLATAGEVIVQATAGSVGLMLAPLFNFFTHVYGVIYWQKNTDSDGDMLPKSANKYVWVITILFIITGLVAFPSLNDWLMHQGHGIIDDDGSRFLGVINFFWINVVAFVLSITAQAMMIMRYSFNWWLWTAVNFVWLIVNLMSGNYIFAIQTCVYQINAIVGLYGWYKSQQLDNPLPTH